MSTPIQTQNFDVREQYDVPATVTIDDQGYARIIIHSNLGRSIGDSIPLWSVTQNKQIGEITIGPGTIRNGHAII
jgi:hypothetical protein